MNDDTQKFIIEPDGTTATVTWFDDSNTHDSGNWTYTVILKFADADLNPPDSQYDGWEAGTIYKHYKAFKPEMALEVGRKFYDFLMKFRTLYGQEEHVNEWRQRYEIEHMKRLQIFLELEDAKERAVEMQKRVKALTTGHVEKVEADNIQMEQDIEKFLRNIQHVVSEMDEYLEDRRNRAYQTDSTSA